MGDFVPLFLAPEPNSAAASRDGRSTPVYAPQEFAARMPLITPETPAKQRRTAHGAPNDLRSAHMQSNSQRYLQNSMKDRRKNLNWRKRPSTELSQFSALQLDDAENSLPLILQDGGVEQSHRGGCRPAAPPGCFSAVALFSSQSVSPRKECLSRPGGSVSHLPASPDQLEYSQADTEYSNFFGRRILTDYREIRELGSGSFGKVTLHEETSTGAMVAIKVSPPLANPEQRQRFAQERAILALVRGFPHVVQLLDAWEEGRVPQTYLQMEYCKGGSVANMAEARRRRGVLWEEREIFIFLAHMALALDALHTANIVHVDFKPENVLIDENGDYKLSDFGCSVILNEEGRPRRCFVPNGQKTCNVQMTANNNNNNLVDVTALSMPTQLSIMSVEEGDCRYLCSDMLNQKRYLKEGDMFSFGISLFELMSGEPLPQHGAYFLELRSSPPVERLGRRGYSRPLIDLVALLMHKDPTARPTARDVLRFFQLPPQASLSVARWAAVRAKADSGEEQTTTALLEMRYLHAALEVASRLVYVARRAFSGGCIAGGGSHNTGGAGDAQRRRTDVDESCTPKTPIIIPHLTSD